MPDPIDLASFQKGRTEAAAEDAPTTGETPEKQPVKAALLFIQDEDGSWQASPDLSIANRIEPQGVADGQDLIAALNIMLSDIQAEKTANMTLVLMNQMAQAQMQAHANAQVAAGLHLPKS